MFKSKKESTNCFWFRLWILISLNFCVVDTPNKAFWWCIFSSTSFCTFLKHQRKEEKHSQNEKRNELCRLLSVVVVLTLSSTAVQWINQYPVSKQLQQKWNSTKNNKPTVRFMEQMLSVCLVRFLWLYSLVVKFIKIFPGVWLLL